MEILNNLDSILNNPDSNLNNVESKKIEGGKMAINNAFARIMGSGNKEKFLNDLEKSNLTF